VKLDTTDSFWIVEDPLRASELGDIWWETSLAGLERQFRGGWTTERRPTLHTSRDEAEQDARARLAARDAVLNARARTSGPGLPNAPGAATKGE